MPTRYTVAPVRTPAASHHRARRVLVSMLIFLCYLAAGGISANTLLNDAHWWGIETIETPNGWRITWTDVGLATEYPMHVGDLVLTANGKAPAGNDEINRANMLTLRRPGQSGVTAVRWQAPSAIARVLSLGIVLVGLISLLIGFLVFLHATERTLAVRFYVLCITLAMTTVLEPATTFGFLFPIRMADSLSVGLFPGVLASFLWLLLFPVPTPHLRPKGIHHRWLPELPVATGIVIGGLFLYASAVEQGNLLRIAITLGYLQTAAALLLSLVVILIRAVFSRQATLARERARTLLGGMLLGLLPILALTVLPTLLIGRALVAGEISGLALIAIPLSFGYAVVRRDLLRVDSLVRTTALIVLTLIGLGIIAGLLSGILSLFPPPTDIVLGVVAGTALAPFILAGARWVSESWLFPQVRRYRQLIVAGDLIASTAAEPQALAGQLVRQLVSEVHLALPVRQASVFVPEKQARHFVALGDQQNSIHPDVLFPPEISGMLVPPQRQESSLLHVDEVLATRLFSNSGRPVFVASVDPMQLEQESWHLLVPMRLHGRLVSLLALSRREDGQPYSATDVQLLKLLSARRTLALDYALLYEDLTLAIQRRDELDQLKDQFIVTAHHELRTPLTGVQGYVELLRDLGPDGRAARPDEVSLFLDRACEATEVLKEQLDSVLTAAELTVRPDDLKRQPVAVNVVVQRAIHSLEALAQQGHHRVSNKISTDLLVLGDPEALYRIFLNLLSNGLKYSPPGRPILFDGSMMSEPGIDGQGFPGRREPIAELLVRDWGAGIDPKDQEKIFERFTRLERDLNSPVRGSGLGLAITKDLVVRMGGTIHVESDGHTGSTFFVRLPVPAESLPDQPRFTGREKAG